MREKISDIVEIRSGMFCQTVPYGKIRYIQSQDFDNRGRLVPLPAHTLMAEFEPRINRHYLQKDEILFAAKGINNFSVIYTPPEEGYQAVASSSFLVLTIRDNHKVLPEYLCWYMNNPETLKRLRLNSKGTSIPSISKSDIMQMEIEIPPIIRQEQIIKFHQLVKEEYYLQSRIHELKNQLLLKAIQ